MNYEIKELRKIGVSELQVSNEAAGMNPGGEGDRAALMESIRDVGLLEPITVTRGDGEDDGWKVLDGAGRLAKLRSRGIIEAECIVVECSDWNQYVLNKNAMGRSRSPGCRIMSYLVLHRADVLEFRRLEMERQGGVGQMTDPPPVQMNGPPVEDAEFSAQSIAERLGYKKDNKDVRLGIQLLWCEAEGVNPDGHPLTGFDAERIHDVLTDVLRGKTPLRRWRAGFAGKMTGSQAGESGRAAADYAEVGSRGFKNLHSAWKNWDKVSPAKVGGLRDEFRGVLNKAPQCMRYEMAGVIAGSWPEDERRALMRDLKASFGRSSV